MPSVDIDHLQTELPHLIDQAAGRPGDSITITRAGD